MNPTVKVITAVVFLAALFCQTGLGQGGSATILLVDTENAVQYITDVFDASKFATEPNVTPPSTARNFSTFIVMADIVAVNGKPAGGTFLFRGQTVNLRPAPTPGQAIADTTRSSFNEQAFDILQSDGTPVGTIFTSGLGVGAPPPGAPTAVVQSNSAVVGGTGAFLGARGQVGASLAANLRTASVTEDPANRRKNGGVSIRWLIHLLPAFRPEVILTPNGPAVTHSNDFALVTASRPARPGEILSVYVTGLGPAFGNFFWPTSELYFGPPVC